MTIAVFLAGEGKMELGDRAGDFPPDPKQPIRGVLEALLRETRRDGWHVEGACPWRKIRKYAAGKSGHEDVRNVLGVCLHAKQAGAAVLAFSRDTDTERERADAIRDGIARARMDYPELRIVGAAAKPCIEGWLVALTGTRGTESMSRARAKLALEQTGTTGVEAAVALIERTGTRAVAEDAAGLRGFLDDAAVALAAPTSDT